MAEKGKEKETKRITEKRRFGYIGFEVFPGEPKDLFTSDSEKEKLIEAAREKRSSGQILRDQCTLTEERVSYAERLILTLASLVIVGTLFIPWYAAYNVVEDKVEPARTQTLVAEGIAADSMIGADSVGLIAAGDSQVTDTTATAEMAMVDDGPEAAVGVTEDEIGDERAPASSGEEILHSYKAKKKIHREFERLSGFGALISLGSVGSIVFSSGFVLICTGAIFILMTLMCLALPAYTLYGLYGVKGTEDEKALILKRIVKYNWLPVILFVLAMSLSFMGGTYGSNNPAAQFASLGEAYGIGVFLSTISWGVIVSLAGFVLLAAKGLEI